MTIITTVSDLRTYLSDTCDLSHDQADAVAQYLNGQTRERPNYGGDWAEYLDALSLDDVHKIAHEQTPIAFAAIGSDGMAAVVWGIGDTEADAVEDADEQDDPDTEGYVVVSITAAQRAAIEAGDVDVESLGIVLTKDQISAIAWD